MLLLGVSGIDGTWIGATTFSGSAPVVRFDETGEQVQIDSNGDGRANFEIRFVGITEVDQLTATDFAFS